MTSKYIYIMASILLVTGCKKFVEVERPPNGVTSEFVFSTDANATAAMLAVYSGFVRTSNIMGLQGPLGTAADELRESDPTSMWLTNNLSPADGTVLGQWSGPYKFIFNLNAIIEGVNASGSISAPTKSLLLGEAKFLRAFFYFYLTNLYGKTPLLLSTDYLANSVAPRTDQAQIYQQIITDLKAAQQQLPEDYLDAKNTVQPVQERVRANKAAATALLARVYLYSKDYLNAESQATLVLNNTSRYDTVALDNVFLKNTKEAIFQIPPASTVNYSSSALFVLTGAPSIVRPYWLQNGLLNSFEAGDKRRSNWIGSITVSGTTYYYPYKYKVGIGVTATALEYDMPLRVGELYLIRAEARINQGGSKIAEGIADLNVLRKRARAAVTPAVPNPLPALSTALSQPSALQAVEDERRHELFVEMGHRWFDLIRAGKADLILAPLKGADWKPTDKLLPVPISEIQKNANLNPQNEGY